MKKFQFQYAVFPSVEGNETDGWRMIPHFVKWWCNTQSLSFPMRVDKHWLFERTEPIPKIFLGQIFISSEVLGYLHLYNEKKTFFIADRRLRYVRSDVYISSVYAVFDDVLFGRERAFLYRLMYEIKWRVPAYFFQTLYRLGWLETSAIVARPVRCKDIRPFGIGMKAKNSR